MDLTRIRAGDPEALRGLMEEVWTPLVAYLRQWGGEDEEAEDAAQEAFVRLWEHRERWSGSSARAVLFRIGRNRMLDRRRRSTVRRRHREEAAREGGARPTTPVEDLAARELRARVETAVAELPERRREIFRLVRQRGLRYAEVAEVLELSPQTVANQMSRALHELRRALSEHLPPVGEESSPESSRSDRG